MDKPIILFDGICNLCNSAVQFIIKHDKKKEFMFASLQSNIGQKLMKQYHLPADDRNSFILVQQAQDYTTSTVALTVLHKFTGP